MSHKKVAFELIDGIILVSGEIKNVSGYFAVDTGATQTVLNKTCIGVQGATAVFGRAMQHRWLCHPPCLPSGRLRRLSRHRRRLAAENSEGPLGAPTGGLARPQGESRLTPAEPENAASVPVGTPSGVVSPLYTDTYIHSTTNIVEKKAITFDNSTQSSGISMKDTESISVSGEKIELNNVNIMDMDYVETPLRKAKPTLSFLGSIGADILGVGRLIIDYPRKQVVFGATKTPENAKMIKLSFTSKLPIAELKIQQKIYHFVLDTGANQFVMDQAAAPMEMICSSSDIDAPQNIKTLEFAGKKYNNIHGIVTDLSPLRKKLHVDVDGIIGYQLLKDYVCCFDYGSELLYLA